MLRKLIGKIIEYFLLYERKVKVRCEGSVDRHVVHWHRDDAGYDLYASVDVFIPKGSVRDVPTGLYTCPEKNMWFMVVGRSSTFKKKNVLCNVAIIDNGYRGEMVGIVYNFSDEMIKIRKGDRICQVIPQLLLPVRFERGKLGRSERGTNGFGSTGD